MSNIVKQNACPVAKKCSGCQLKNLTYEEQLRMKQVKLIGLLGKFGHVNEIIGMECPYHYRNKVQAAFMKRDGRVLSGVYQSAVGKIVPVDSCMLEDEVSDRIIVEIRNMCRGFKIEPYNMSSGRGFLRHVLVRRGFVSGEVMVVLVTAKGDFPSKRSFVNELLRRHPEITTVVWNINTSEMGLALGSYSEVLYGEGYITDKLCGLDFRISPRSFYQVNPVQTEILYGTAIKYAALTGKEKLIDAYCGTGTIGLCMVKSASKVIGVEINADAIEDAKVNAKLNGIENAEFFALDAGEFMVGLAKAGETADVVVTDPPRAGCSMKFLRCLLTLAPKRIVYVSCNPDTLARDLHTLTKGGYKVKKIQPVDMFPHTNHVECVVLLSR